MVFIWTKSNFLNVEKKKFKTLAVFLAIFVANTKIVFHYDFVAPLMD